MRKTIHCSTFGALTRSQPISGQFCLLVSIIMNIFVILLECQQPSESDENRPRTSSSLATTSSSVGSSSVISDDSENKFRLSGSKLIVNEDYFGTSNEELSVSTGDEVFVNMDDQLLEGWYWVYSSRLKTEGFIPRSVVYSLRISNV